MDYFVFFFEKIFCLEITREKPANWLLSMLRKD